MACTKFTTDARKYFCLSFVSALMSCFFYEYDFADLWQHLIRLEVILLISAKNLTMARRLGLYITDSSGTSLNQLW
jgi:hypothetical protein